MACHVIHADWCVRRNAQRNFPEHCTADAWQGLFSRNRHAAVARDGVHADDRHCAAVFKSDFKVVFNPSDHHLRFG